MHLIYGEYMSCNVETLETGNRWIISRSVDIDAPASAVFDIIADPRQHADFDGSKTVLGLAEGPNRLALDARFRMKMRIKVPYHISNSVVEFAEGERIAWSHLGGHRWRYEVASLTQGTCRVTETFDASYARSAQALRLMNAYTNNAKAIEKTLCRLKSYAQDVA